MASNQTGTTESPTRLTNHQAEHLMRGMLSSHELQMLLRNKLSVESFLKINQDSLIQQLGPYKRPDDIHGLSGLLSKHYKINFWIKKTNAHIQEDIYKSQEEVLTNTEPNTNKPEETK